MASEIVLKLEKSLYEREAIFACVQLFQEEASVRICGIEEGNVLVHLEGVDVREVANLEKKFREELIHQQVRRDLNVQFGNLREMIVQQAFFPINAKKS